MTPIRVRRRSVLPALAAVILACCLGGCGPIDRPASFEEVAALPPDHSSPQGIVRSFLTRIGTGRFAEAYDITSPRARRDLPLEEFVELHARVLSGAILERFDIVKSEPAGAGAVEVHITYQMLLGEDHRHTMERTYRCVQLDGVWWVDYTPTRRLRPAEDPPEASAAGG